MEAITKLYKQYLEVTGDADAAATLVLAHVTGRQQTENLSVKEAAKQMGVSTATIYALCDSGQLRHRKIGRAIRIQPQDLRDYMDTTQHEAAPTSFPLLGI